MDQSILGPHTGLTVDLYHPDSAYVSWRSRRNGLATFDLFSRSAPFGGAYMLVAGLELALEFVQSFRFTDEDLRYLSQIRDYDHAFLDHLRNLRFTGEILAMPEGSIAFPNEPLLRVTAPFQEALLLESGLLHMVSLSTLIATKASRLVHAAKGRPVADFALRRAQSPFVVTRSAYIGGCSSTSFLAAAYEYRLRASGTIPHALVQLYDSEREGFAAVAESFNRYNLLLDTYQVHDAIHTAVEVAREYQDRMGHTLVAVRLDSGDLGADARYVRGVLDDAHMPEVRILASGDLDEFRIEELMQQNAPIDGFGVGTSLGVGGASLKHNAPGCSLGAVYKMSYYEDIEAVDRPKIKLAGEKSTWPGKKEVYRIGSFERDVIQLAEEPRPDDGARMLKPVVQDGRLLPGALPPLSEIWELAQRNLQQLPEEYAALAATRRYPVDRSAGLMALRKQAIQRYGGEERPEDWEAM
ncbi:MAG TPA: nicotinate phosphoribosyltransferase [Chloroflexota bacterium]|nr:nicotinate phosphoribosyltransferase [Chloroflexota bacterium]